MNKTFVFLGYGDLALSSLKKLMEEGFKPIELYSYSLEEQDQLTKYCAENMIVIRTSNPNKSLLSDNFDFKESLLISINYRRIIDAAVINRFQHAINLHGSLLPKYRGRSPHVWAMINGEKEIGVTAHLMVARVDQGPILSQKKFEVKQNYTIASVMDIFISIYPDLLIEAIHNAISNRLILQLEADASYYGKRTPEMSYIDINKNRQSILDFIRALSDPYPNAFFYLGDSKKIYIKSAQLADSYLNLSNDIELIDGYYYLRCVDGPLRIVDFALEE
jgi:methionyl-tRNA formyltransferase